MINLLQGDTKTDPGKLRFNKNMSLSQTSKVHTYTFNFDFKQNY